LRRAILIATGLLSAALAPALASYGELPSYFAESWAVVDAAPLLREVPSSGKQARLPVRTQKAAVSPVAPGPAPVLTRSLATSAPGEATDLDIPSERPVLRPSVLTYASLGTPELPRNVLADVPMPVERPDAIPQPSLPKAPRLEAKEPPPAEEKPTLLAMLGTPLAGKAIGNLVKMAAMEPVGNGACRVEKPFKVLAAGSSLVDLQPAATLNDEMAKAVGEWAKDVEAAAAKHLGQKIETIMVAGSYDCRTMNHIRRARLSEHSHANALDVAGFRLADGDTVTITKDWRGSGKKTAFLKAVHDETCDRFQVVLGPGSDGYHENHLHMDLGRWRACR
jgi:hypothetical protein